MLTATTLTAEPVELTDDEHEHEHERGEPWLFRLLSRAAAFSEVLKTSAKDERGADVVDLVGRDLATLADRRSAPHKLVVLSAASWLRRSFSKGPSLAGSDSSDEDDGSEPHSASLSLPSTPPTPGFVPLPTPDLEPVPLPASEPDIPPLTAEEKVALIISEFGSLGDGERLLLETDATFFQDVVILGVVHLTTHRLTFHASLLDARPDLAPGVRHSGSAIVRGKGLRPKKRVWLELTHDMITSFRSSDEHARVRPLRTILLSAFRRIDPVDPAHPRTIRFTHATPRPPPAQPHRALSLPLSLPLSRSHSRSRATPTRSPTTSTTSTVKSSSSTPPSTPSPQTPTSSTTTELLEFDTPEAALAWRRELHAALYLFRRRRRALLADDTDIDTGVRVNVPLASVRAWDVCDWAGVGSVLRVDLVGADGEKADGPACVSGQGVLSRGWEQPHAGAGTAPARLQFSLLRAGEGFGALLGRLVAARRGDGGSAVPAVVDFGGLTFVEEGLDDVAKDGGLEAGCSTERRVRKVFGLGTELDIWITKARLARCRTLPRTLATAGLLVVSARFVCFWSRLWFAGADVQLRVPTPDVRAEAAGAAGMALRVRGQEDMVFAFAGRKERDAAVRRIQAHAGAERRGHARAPSLPVPLPSPPLTPFVLPSFDALPTPPHTPSHTATHTPTPTALLSPLSRTLPALAAPSFPARLLPHLAAPINVPPRTPFGVAPMHFVVLTVGSRGDVQPYIALARGLIARAHRVTIVTHPEYRAWIEGWGVGWRGMGGDPGRLMKLSVEHKMFSPQFFRESIGNFRTWIDEVLADAWAQCQDADVIIESPPAMAGVHVAEALGIPYFRAFTMPWSKTTQYPHAMMSPPVENSARFNAASYILFDNVFWLGTSGQINRWRKKSLGLDATDMGHMAQARIPFLYNFSPSVVPKPLDWGDHITVTGYWFLNDPDTGWTPPPSLLAFIAKARADGKALVYVGFGSITVPRPRAMTRSIVKAVLKSDVRVILSKGWSERVVGAEKREEGEEVELPEEVYGIDKVPHDWLFPQMDAALHHGGAGTTGASLRAGIPTLIKPWFGDQFFWASRVQKLGAGLRVPSLRSADLADALRKATTDRVMREKAAQVGEQIAQEDGVPTAIQAIYTYLHRAKMDRTTLEK